MLLRFTFVPWGSAHHPWRRRSGALQPVRGESRLMSRWPSPPRGASDRPPLGSGFALDRRRQRMVFRCFLLCLLLSEVSPSAGFIDPHRLMARTQNYGLEEHNQQVLLLPSPGDPGTLHLYVLSPKPAGLKSESNRAFIWRKHLDISGIFFRNLIFVTGIWLKPNSIMVNCLKHISFAFF